MKFASPAFPAVVVALYLVTVIPSGASEPAHVPVSAVETLRAGIEVHPEQAAALFQDSLQTNPDSRRALFVAALETMGDDRELVRRLVSVARLEFPDDEAELAELALAILPEQADEIRETFARNPESVLAGAGDRTFPLPRGDAASTIPVMAGQPEGTDAEGAGEPLSTNPRRMDEQIREAIARAAAQTSGRSRPGQRVADLALHLRKPDEVRIPRMSRGADESSLYQDLPLDQTDEREVTPGQVRLDDSWKPSESIRLDESRFAEPGGDAERHPRKALGSSLEPAGAVGLPKRPMLRSSAYRNPPAAGSYESTIDLESGDSPPPLIIRPGSASPAQPH